MSGIAEYVASYINNLDWNILIVTQLRNKIKELKNYGEQLTRQGIAKGNIIKTLVDDLYNQLNVSEQEVSLQDENRSPNTEWKNKLATLRLKVNFKKKLHSQDETLNEYRGYTRLIVNILSIVSTFAIANLVNLYYSNKFLFFNEVTSNKLVGKIDEQLAAQKVSGYQI